MERISDPLAQALLDDWQRDFPLVARPFAHMADRLGVTESEVIAGLGRQMGAGRISRIGATCAPNTVSASTLAAIAAPDDRIEEVAGVIGAEPGVNHSYLREHDWNLWFVATGPDRAHVDAALARIGQRTGLRVLDLRLVRPFNVDLGFALRSGEESPPPIRRPIDRSAFRDSDRPLLQALLRGLELVPRPWLALAGLLGCAEEEVLARTATLVQAGIIARLGVIVRHRALGWRANAMVVWDMSHDAITTAGPLLARQPGITLCYERTTVPGIWPYRLYSMIHARSRPDAMAVLDRVCALPEFRDIPHVPLFSLRCFKQTGATVLASQKETA